MAKKQIGEVDYNVEFNDSVLSTKTWNNPRYDGCQTETQNINKFTVGDITYGKTASTQKYTRNIYVGDSIIACSSSASPVGADFEVLVPFPDFSYCTVSSYITVNSDDSIEEINYDGTVIESKEGYYRTFTEDFGAGTSCKVLLLDRNIENFLEDQYNVYFSDGQLRKHLLFANDPLNNSITIAGADKFRYIDAGGSGNLSQTVTLFQGRGYENYYPSNTISTYNDLDSYFDSASAHASEDSNNRFFLTITTGSDGLTFFDLDTNLNNRRGIKTYEIQNNTGLTRIIALSTKFGSNVSDHGFGNYPSYFISQLNDSTPSVLINLPENQLPNGLVPGNVVNTDGTINFEALPGFSGPKFVLIPDNLHPYIKDNINYFLNQAGLLDSNQPLTINPRNRQLS